MQTLIKGVVHVCSLERVWSDARAAMYYEEAKIAWPLARCVITSGPQMNCALEERRKKEVTAAKSRVFA